LTPSLYHNKVLIGNVRRRSTQQFADLVATSRARNDLIKLAEIRSNGTFCNPTFSSKFIVPLYYFLGLHPLLLVMSVGGVLAAIIFSISCALFVFPWAKLATLTTSLTDL
jgi:hypothetical protein